MAQPTPYDRSTDFSSDEFSNVGGRSTVRTAALDAELDGIETTLDQLCTNIALIQRDDGKLRDLTVELHTLGSDTRALLAAGQGTPRGAWLTATAYALRDIVSSGGNSYLCALAHTSAGAFSTDLAAGRWLLLANSSAPSFSSGDITHDSGASYPAGTAGAALNTALALRADLASTADAAKGAALVGYSDALTYPPGSVGAKLKAVVSSSGLLIDPRAPAYGADPTGVADSTEAFQGALDDAQAAGGAVALPPGIYKVSQLFLRNGVRAFIGYGGVLSLMNVANAGLLLQGRKGAMASDVADLELFGLRIDCNNNSSTTVAIWGQNVSNVRITHCDVYNVADGYGILLRNYVGLASPSGGGNRIESCRVFAAARNSGSATANVWGIAVDAEPVYSATEGSSVSTHADAPSLWKAAFVGPTSQAYNTGNVIANNRVYGGYYGFMLHGLVDSLVDGNATEANVRGFSIQNRASRNVISGNKVLECYSAGIHLAYGSSNCVLSDNHVYTTVGAGEALIQCYVGCTDNTIVGNHVNCSAAVNGNSHGIYAAVHASRTAIRSNTVRGRFRRASIAVESAWSTAVTNIYHYGQGASTPANVDDYANSATVDVVIAGNTVHADVASSRPSILLGQINNQNGYSAMLLGTTLAGNTCVADGGSINQLYLIEATSGNLRDIVATGNVFAVPATPMTTTALDSYMVLPRGRAHFRMTSGNYPLDNNSAAVTITGTAPNVGGAGYFACANVGSTTIATLAGGGDGQTIRLRMDNLTGVTHNSSGAAGTIRLAGASTIAPGSVDADKWLELRCQGGVWFEMSRNFGGGSGSSSAHHLRIRHATATVLPASSEQVMVWDPADISTAAWNAGTNTYTAPEAGYYLVAARLHTNNYAWAIDTALSLRLSVNGVAGERGTWDPSPATTTNNQRVSQLATVIYLGSGDQLTVRYFHNHSASVNLNGVPRDNFLNITKVA